MTSSYDQFNGLCDKQEVELNMKNPKSKFSKEVKKRHREERDRARVYIRSLQYDNEVLFVLKMKKAGLVW